MTQKPKTILEYINTVPEDVRPKLRELHSILKEVVPLAKVAIKWGYPVFEQKRILFSYSAHKTHINFMPTRSTLKQFTKELKDYKTGQDTVQFPYDKPLPKTLIQKLARYRLREVIEENSLWMHNK